MNSVAVPNIPPATNGLQNEMLGYDVHANQNREIVSRGAAIMHVYRRTSGARSEPWRWRLLSYMRWSTNMQ